MRAPAGLCLSLNKGALWNRQLNRAERNRLHGQKGVRLDERRGVEQRGESQCRPHPHQPHLPHRELLPAALKAAHKVTAHQSADAPHGSMLRPVWTQSRHGEDCASSAASDALGTHVMVAGRCAGECYLAIRIAVSGSEFRLIVPIHSHRLDLDALLGLHGIESERDQRQLGAVQVRAGLILGRTWIGPPIATTRTTAYWYPWVNLLASSLSTSASQRATGKSRLSAPVPKFSTSRGLRAKVKLTSGCKEADA